MSADAASRELLARSVAAWRDRHGAALAAAEEPAAAAAALGGVHDDLAALGVLDALAGDEGLALAATAVRELAEVSAGTALLVAVRNVSAAVFAAVGREAPSGWLALPLYDDVATLCPTAAGADGPVLVADVTAVAGLPVASCALLAVSLPDGEPALVAVVPQDRRPVPMLGLRSCPAGDLPFAGPAAPAPLDVLARGESARALWRDAWYRAEVLVAALRAGLLRAAWRTAEAHAAERWQGGRLIAGHSQVQRMLADVAVVAARAESLWRDGCVDRSEPAERRGLLARALAGAADLPAVVSDCLQILGGGGYTEDAPQARRFRDAKQSELLLGHPQTRRLALRAGEGDP